MTEQLTHPPKQQQDFDTPPLNTGDHLTRAEFERRYANHPDIKKAELIEGVVFMPSAVRFKTHSEPHGYIVTLLGVYAARTAGVQMGDNASVRLDNDNEVQPDALLRIKADHGGQTALSGDDYVDGPPELVAEIVASSAAYDLHAKRHVYARSGVREYLAIQMYEKRIDWFVLTEGVFETLSPGEDGILKSTVFPGLWLKPAAFWAGDLAAMLDVLQQGLDSDEHTTFRERLRVE